MKKIVLMFMIVVFSISMFGCSNSQVSDMTFEEFKEKYNENVRREGLPLEYLIRYDNTDYHEVDDTEGYIIKLPDKIVMLVVVRKNQPPYVIERILIVENGVERVAEFLLPYSLAARCFDERWKDTKYTATQGRKLLEGDIYSKGNYEFASSYISKTNSLTLAVLRTKK